jgi:predicted HTH transcriptional regulator
MTDELLRRLLNRKAETRNLDYKEAFNWFSSTNDQKCEIIKDILGMLNTQDGGRIVIGVADDDHIPIGVDQQSFVVPARCTNM